MAETFPERYIYALSALGDIGLTTVTRDLMRFCRSSSSVPLTTLISRFIYLSWKGASVTTSICIPGVCVQSVWKRVKRRSFDDEDVSGDSDEPETEVIYVRE